MEFSIRAAEDRDIPGMAAIRAQEWESETYWTARIGGYLRGERHPQHALPARTAFVAISEDVVIGFVAGHRTQRFGCDGELEWINVAASFRGRGVSGKLLRSMAAWFIAGNARRVCVNVAPENMPARRLYARSGAAALNPFWMVWQDISKALEE